MKPLQSPFRFSSKLYFLLSSYLSVIPFVTFLFGGNPYSRCRELVTVAAGDHDGTFIHYDLGLSQPLQGGGPERSAMFPERSIEVLEYDRFGPRLWHGAYRVLRNSLFLSSIFPVRPDLFEKVVSRD